jgi:hypothetical protein
MLTLWRSYKPPLQHDRANGACLAYMALRRLDTLETRWTCPDFVDG